MHPRRRRCSSFKYSRYSQSSRLAGGAPRSSRCDARLSPRAVRVTTDRRAPGTRAFLAATLVLFTFLTFVMTYPQALHMTDGVHDDGDPFMVTWVLAWVAHQLP